MYLYEGSADLVDVCKENHSDLVKDVIIRNNKAKSYNDMYSKVDGPSSSFGERETNSSMILEEDQESDGKFSIMDPEQIKISLFQ